MVKDKKNILFYCIGNSCRSQMAEGFAKKYGKNKFNVFSAGSQPLGKVSIEAIEVMQKVGIDIKNQKSKGFNNLKVNDFDLAISMGCSDACPFVPAEKHIDLKIEDPFGKSIEKFREVRDVIEKEVIIILTSEFGV